MTQSNQEYTQLIIELRKENNKIINDSIKNNNEKDIAKIESNNKKIEQYREKREECKKQIVIQRKEKSFEYDENIYNEIMAGLYYRSCIISSGN